MLQSIAPDEPALIADASELMCWAPDQRGADGAPTAHGIEIARNAMAQAEAFAAAGHFEDAVLQLRVVEREMPRVADRIGIRRGELLRKLHMPEQACEAFALANDSPDRGIAAEARIDGVHCMLEAGNRKGESELDALLKRYPQLSQREQLMLELAQAREQWGSKSKAADLLRKIDLEYPASPFAPSARAELMRLQAEGVRVAAYSNKERVERTERMLREAPVEQTLAEIDALLHEPKLSPDLRAQTLILSARIARVEGRWQDVADMIQEARKLGARVPDLGKLAVAVPPHVDTDEDRAAIERHIRSVRGVKPIARLNPAQLRTLFDIAVPHAIKDTCDEVIDAVRTNRKIPAPVRFDMAIRATGLASDDKLAALLETLLEVPAYRVSARYHYARALERLGKSCEAEAEYVRVQATERGTGYYGMWSDLRLGALRNQPHPACPAQPSAARVSLAPAAPGAAGEGFAGEDDLGAIAQGDTAGTQLEVLDAGFADQEANLEAKLNGAPGLLSGKFDERDQGLAKSPGETGAARPTFAANPNKANTAPPDAAARKQRALALLAPIAERFGEAYPWLPRAQDLIELDLSLEAADELSEAYLAWRDVTGALRMRSGLLCLLTGTAPPRRAVTSAVAKARRALDPRTRETLGEVAKLVGDPGIGFRFANDREDARPRAYSELVERAARKYGLDPNLLFAVMRVESIYNRRIISNVGAVGLMQIMPATGQRIAYQLGVKDFDTVHLLNPQVNLDFAAWYLSSLLKRFDGRLPLAIASYNGGPHNVRLWLRGTSPKMPMDAFLERIPFDQTHRYVRRVLTYYMAYRAQQKLPMTRLSVELPQLSPDKIAF